MAAYREICTVCDRSAVLTWLAFAGHLALPTLPENHLAAYLAHETARGEYGPRMIRRKVMAACRALRWAVSTGMTSGPFASPWPARTRAAISPENISATIIAYTAVDAYLRGNGHQRQRKNPARTIFDTDCMAGDAEGSGPLGRRAARQAMVRVDGVEITPEDLRLFPADRRMADLYADGITSAELSRATGYHRETIQRHPERFGMVRFANGESRYPRPASAAKDAQG